MAITIRKIACPEPPVGADLMKTGQTTSYRTGDDGDIEAGRDVDFFTLSANNPFGNTNRFTDELGGTAYANNWVIDWSTYNGSNVLGYYRVAQPFTNWNDAVDNCRLNTFGTFSGCRLANLRETTNLFYAAGFFLSFAPFSYPSGLSTWTSTTYFNDANIAHHTLFTNNVRTALKSTTGSYRALPVRTFTVNGTTLT